MKIGKCEIFAIKEFALIEDSIDTKGKHFLISIFLRDISDNANSSIDSKNSQLVNGVYVADIDEIKKFIQNLNNWIKKGGYGVLKSQDRLSNDRWVKNRIVKLKKYLKVLTDNLNQTT
tara:strand:- start:518 stop:871 length:354 start_codon:yes stop_codon:yes gene_type:complete